MSKEKIVRTVYTTNQVKRINKIKVSVLDLSAFEKCVFKRYYQKYRHLDTALIFRDISVEMTHMSGCPGARPVNEALYSEYHFWMRVIWLTRNVHVYLYVASILGLLGALRLPLSAAQLTSGNSINPLTRLKLLISPTWQPAHTDADDEDGQASVSGHRCHQPDPKSVA